MENELVARLKIHDQRALKILFDTYHTSLCVLADTIVKDKDQAKDIVQDVFIKVWRNRERLEITTSIKAYLRKATVNTALNHIESASAMKKQDVSKANLTFLAKNTTDEALEYDELKMRADLAISQLPIRTRMVFNLIRSDQMTYKEVSETLSISIKAVEKEMMKALRILREVLKDYLPIAVATLFLV